MKFLVYHAASERGSYHIETLHDGETCEVFESREFEKDGTKAIIPRPHIVIKRDGQQTNIVTGDFVDLLDDQKEARKLVGRLESVKYVMES